ncbi:hypothetical protein B0H14DRAFT_3702017 [Mycena olivaceomarginata]|nr:hypothetical protein B0H14DRAFT_3702017 [Mycena olivaceomarginata]
MNELNIAYDNGASGGKCATVAAASPTVAYATAKCIAECTASHVTCKPATIVPSATAPHEFLGYVSNHRWRGAASLPMKFCKRQGSGRCSAADRLPRLSVTEMIRMSHGLGMPGTAAETYCLEGPKPVADSIVYRNRFGATDTSSLRPPEIVTDTLSISRNIKYTQTPAETENIGSPETASGIGLPVTIPPDLFVAYKVQFLQLLFWPIY